MPDTILEIIDTCKKNYESLKTKLYPDEKERALKIIFSHAYDDVVITDLIGTMYYEGTGVEKNFNKALNYYKTAAKKNYPLALYHIGDMYFKGIGCKKNYDESYKYLFKAIEKIDYIYSFLIYMAMVQYQAIIELLRILQFQQKLELKIHIFILAYAITWAMVFM